MFSETLNVPMCRKLVTLHTQKRDLLRREVLFQKSELGLILFESVSALDPPEVYAAYMGR